MKTMLRAAFAALSIASIGSAHANEGEAGQIADTLFTEIPGVIAQAPVQHVPPVATAQTGSAVHQAYVTNSRSGTWLFPPYQGGNG